MSVVTNIIIVHNCGESYERKEPVLYEINKYFDFIENDEENAESSKRYFKSIGEDVFVGGDKNWEAQTYMAANNYMNIKKFLKHLSHINWQFPQDVFVLVQEQDSNSFTEVFQNFYNYS